MKNSHACTYASVLVVTLSSEHVRRLTGVADVVGSPNPERQE